MALADPDGRALRSLQMDPLPSTGHQSLRYRLEDLKVIKMEARSQKWERPEVVTIDVRSLIPSYRHPVILAILGKLREIRAPEALQVVSDHKPVGLPMELEMREQTKGRYDLSYEEQEGGVWLIRI